MLLAGHNGTALPGGLQHQLLVQRLDGVHVYDLGGDALGREGLGCLQGGLHHEAARHDGDVGALAHEDALANLELKALGVVDHGDGQAAEAHVDGAVGGIGGAHGGLGLGVVARDDDGHARDGAHEGDVLVALVGGAVLANGDARVGGTDLHRQVRVADGVAHDLVGTTGREHGKGAGKGLVARGGNAGGHAHEVALGDANVKEALGVGGLELAGLRGGGKVRVQDHKVIVLGGQLDERLAVAGARGNLLHVCHPRPPSRRWRQARPCPARTARHWGPCRANPPGSP